MNNLLRRENIQYLPLAAVGLAIGVAEYVIQPFLEDTAKRIGQNVMARIEYISTDENNNNH